MKIKLSITLCLWGLLSLPSPGNGEEGSKVFGIHGYEWEKQTYSFKLGYLSAWRDGLKKSILIAKNIALDYIEKDMKEDKELARLDKISRLIEMSRRYRMVTEKMDHIIQRHLRENGFDLEFIDNEQIIKTIDQMYIDQRVKKWEVSTVMLLVWGKLKGGWTEKDLEEVISYENKKDDFYRIIDDINDYENLDEIIASFNIFYAITVKKPKVLE